MNYSINQLRDFSSLFSRSEVNRWLEDDFESIDLKLQRYKLSEKNKGNSYLNVLRQTYKILEKNYPNEYILKNEFLTQWLKKEFGNSDSIIFNELRIGKAIADLAMFNGKSKVFETISASVPIVIVPIVTSSNELRPVTKLLPILSVVIIDS